MPLTKEEAQEKVATIFLENNPADLYADMENNLETDSEALAEYRNNVIFDVQFYRVRVAYNELTADERSEIEAFYQEELDATGDGEVQKYEIFTNGYPLGTVLDTDITDAIYNDLTTMTDMEYYNAKIAAYTA